MISQAMAQMMTRDAIASAGVVYAFIITEVWVSALEDDGETPKLEPLPAPYEYGPADAVPDTVGKAVVHGQPWRVLDDDGYPMAAGRMWTSDSPLDWSQSEAAFAPLDDYGRGEHGCTTLQYWSTDADEWVTL